jgi:hypothetical protein
LLGNSIAYGWYKQGADVFSFFLGGLGIASFATLFFIRPQTGINEALGNLAQMQMIYKACSLEFEAVSDYDWEKFTKGGRDIKEVNLMNVELERSTERYVQLVQSNIEKQSASKDDQGKG